MKYFKKFQKEKADPHESAEFETSDGFCPVTVFTTLDLPAFLMPKKAMKPFARRAVGESRFSFSFVLFR